MDSKDKNKSMPQFWAITLENGQCIAYVFTGYRETALAFGVTVATKSSYIPQKLAAVPLGRCLSTEKAERQAVSLQAGGVLLPQGMPS